MHDRRDGVEEGERVFAGEIADGVGERGRGEGPVQKMMLSRLPRVRAK